MEAAYEETNLAEGGECESDIVCPIASGFEPVRKFLLQYPDSVHSAEAAKRADAAFRGSLWGEHWKTYNAEELKKLVQEYEEIAEKMPAKFRPRIYETAAYYHARLHETNRARESYNRILLQAPDYENGAEVRKALSELH